MSDKQFTNVICIPIFFYKRFKAWFSNKKSNASIQSRTTQNENYKFLIENQVSIKFSNCCIVYILTQIWFGALKVKNYSYLCGELLTFNAYYLNLSYQIWVGFIFVCQKSLKRTFKTGFWKSPFIFFSDVNLQRLLCR